MLLDRKPRHPAAFDVICELLEFGFGSDPAPFAAGQRGLRTFYGPKDLDTLPFTFFPQRQGLLNHLFFVCNTAAGDRLANECLLTKAELDVHSLRLLHFQTDHRISVDLHPYAMDSAAAGRVLQNTQAPDSAELGASDVSEPGAGADSTF